MALEKPQDNSRGQRTNQTTIARSQSHWQLFAYRFRRRCDQLCGAVHDGPANIIAGAKHAIFRSRQLDIIPARTSLARRRHAHRPTRLVEGRPSLPRLVLPREWRGDISCRRRSRHRFCSTAGGDYGDINDVVCEPADPWKSRPKVFPYSLRCVPPPYRDLRSTDQCLFSSKVQSPSSESVCASAYQKDTSRSAQTSAKAFSLSTSFFATITPERM